MIFAKAPARAFLYLDVIGADPLTGFHYVSGICMKIPSIYDEIVIEKRDGAFNVEIINESEDFANFDYGEDNICFKTACQLYKKVNSKSIGEDIAKKTSAISISIKKNIPKLQGLGGSASNAASVLVALNKLWDLNLSKNELIEIGSKISVDTAFFLTDTNYAIINHLGELVEPIDSKLALDCTFIPTDSAITPEWAFSNLPERLYKHSTHKALPLINAINNNDKEAVMRNLHNDFTAFVFDTHPVIASTALAKSKEFKKVILCGVGGGLLGLN